MLMVLLEILWVVLKISFFFSTVEEFSKSVSILSLEFVDFLFLELGVFAWLAFC